MNSPSIARKLGKPEFMTLSRFHLVGNRHPRVSGDPAVAVAFDRIKILIGKLKSWIPAYARMTTP